MILKERALTMFKFNMLWLLCTSKDNAHMMVSYGNSGQLRYQGKHHYLSAAELHAGLNYYKIPFSHINYYLQFVNVKLL